MSAGQTDNEIISLVLRGEQQYFNILVNRYKDYAFTIALRITRTREDAEEVAQDAFVKAYRFLNDFKAESKFSTWFYTIVHTTAISSLRKKRLAAHSLDDEQVFAAADTIDSGMSANTVEQKSKLKMVNEAISLLSADDASILTLFYKAEQSIEETASILGIETNAVKVRLFRARQRLKEKMEKYFTEELKDIYQ
jgi:RNA polymerase sigma-70 factor (ECF subfamily)